METFLDDLNTPKVIAKLNEEANSVHQLLIKKRLKLKKSFINWKNFRDIENESRKLAWI